MSGALAYAEAHPVYIAGGVFAVGAAVVIGLRLSRNSTPAPMLAAAAYNPGPSAAAVQAATQVQLGQIAAQARTVGVQASLQAALAKNAAALQAAQLGYDVQRYQIATTGSTQQGQTAGAVQIHQIDSNAVVARSQNALDSLAYQQAIAAGHDSTSVQLAQLANAAQSQHDDSYGNVAVQEATLQHFNVIEEQHAIIDSAASKATVAAAQLNNNYNLAITGMNLNAQTQETVAAYNAKAAMAKAKGPDNTAKDVTQGLESAAMIAMMFL